MSPTDLPPPYIHMGYGIKQIGSGVGTGRARAAQVGCPRDWRKDIAMEKACVGKTRTIEVEKRFLVVELEFGLDCNTS